MAGGLVASLIGGLENDRVSIMSEFAAGIRLEPGTLRDQAERQSQRALDCGALQPVDTTYEFVEHEGVAFLVRILKNLIRKDKDKQQQGKDFNPFLPYDPNLFVADITDSHLCLLNKFNVVDLHLLIVTRTFVEQDTLLTQSDFEALWLCLAELDGLVFYNGGPGAGASQRHKHLQLIPFPLGPDGMQLPIEQAIASAQFQGGIGQVPNFPFKHAIASLSPAWRQSPTQAAATTLDTYFKLLAAVGWPITPEPRLQPQPGPYNLLVTRSWMMLIPRSQEGFEGISVNSLGFAGALLVRNSDQMQQLKDLGPMTLLQQVAIAQANEPH